MTSKLKALEVYGETEVGWDENTPPNETIDADGNPFPEDPGFGVPDPRAPARRRYDAPDVVALREHLRQLNGIRGLEICSLGEIERVVRVFHRDGFVVVRDLLDVEALAALREGSARYLKDILSIPAVGNRKYLTESGRLPHRYSFSTSSASRQLLHDAVWASMIDLPGTTPLLKAIFGSSEYYCMGAGGEVALPGAIEYQHLHIDIYDHQDISEARLQQARDKGVDLRTGRPDIDEAIEWRRRDGEEGPLEHSRRLVLERTPPLVTINFLMSDLTWENGPIRQIPGTHTTVQRPPTPEEEPEWMRLSTLVGAPAGAGVIRDNRAWHGATPNLSREIRVMPSVEYGAPWLTAQATNPEWFQPAIPHEIWETLSPHAQHISRRLKLEPGEWPDGAGIMHPLASGRRKAVEGRRGEGGKNGRS